MKILSCFLALSAMLSSCVLLPHDCKETVTCMNPYVDAEFYGFKKNEIDTIVVNTRKAGEPSSIPISSMNFNEQSIRSMAKSLGHPGADTFNPYKRVTGINGNDTFFTPSFPSSFIEGMNEPYEYEVILPGVQTFIVDSVKLTGTPTEEIIGSCTDQFKCARYLKSYRVNGKTFTPAHPSSKLLQFEK